MKNKIKQFFPNIYYKDDFNFIEQTEDGKYIFYPRPEKDGFEVESLKDLKPILINWRILEISTATNILFAFMILFLIIHQFIQISEMFFGFIFGFCLVLSICGIIANLSLKRYKKVKAKSKCK